MAQSIKNVIIIGAGGNVGTVLVDALLAHSAGFHVTVFSRKGSTKTYPASLKVLTVEPSASVDELATTFAGQDAVVDLTRGDGLEDHKKYIDAAVKAGVKRYIPSQYGCDTADERVVKVMKPIFDGKVATAEYLKGKEKDGLTWTGIVTNPFFDWGFRFGTHGFTGPSKTATIYDAGSTRFHTTDLRAVALATAGVLADPSATANRYVYVSSFHVSQNDILAAIRKVDDAEWKVEHASAKEALEQGRGMLGDPSTFISGYIGMLRGILFGGAAGQAGFVGGEQADRELDYVATRGGADNELLGLPPVQGGGSERLEETIRSVLKGELAEY